MNCNITLPTISVPTPVFNCSLLKHTSSHVFTFFLKNMLLFFPHIIKVIFFTVFFCHKYCICWYYFSKSIHIQCTYIRLNPGPNILSFGSGQDLIKINQDLIKIDQDLIKIDQDLIKIDQDLIKIDQDPNNIYQDPTKIYPDPTKIDPDSYYTIHTALSDPMDEIAWVRVMFAHVAFRVNN